VLKSSAEDLVDEKLSHVQDLACVCNTKFNVLKIGLWTAPRLAWVLLSCCLCWRVNINNRILKSRVPKPEPER